MSVGNSLSLADFGIELLCDGAARLSVPLDSYPHLRKVRQAVAANPRLADWFKSEKRFPQSAIQLD